MEDIKIIFSTIWIACMLCYCLGDILRIFAGEVTPGEIEGKKIGQSVYFVMALIMVIPIIMVVLSVILENPVNSWVNLITAIAFLLFNLAGIKGYKPFDIFLLIVSFGFNVLTIYYAWSQLFV
jgi:hypothetical protein